LIKSSSPEYFSNIPRRRTSSKVATIELDDEISESSSMSKLFELVSILE
jgi:hypothetical protein